MEDDRERAHKAWRRADRIRILSDRVVSIGPWGLGIDGVLSWVPGAGTAYSVGAAALLFAEAIQAGASRATLLKMAAYLGIDTASSAVPVVGWAVDTFYRGHAMAARTLMGDIERRFGAPPEPRSNLDARARRARPVGSKVLR